MRATPDNISIRIQSLHDYVIYLPFTYKEKLRNVDWLPKTKSVIVHTIAELITNKIKFANVKKKNRCTAYNITDFLECL